MPDPVTGVPRDEDAMRKANMGATTREVVRLYLEAVGATVETRRCGCDNGYVEAGPAGATYSAPCVLCVNGTLVRTITPWKPLTDTDGVCKERSTAGSECYHHDGHDTPHSWEEATDTEEER